MCVWRGGQPCLYDTGTNDYASALNEIRYIIIIYISEVIDPTTYRDVR